MCRRRLYWDFFNKYRVARKNVPNFRMALCDTVDEMNLQKSMYVMSVLGENS